jgi:transposase
VQDRDGARPLLEQLRASCRRIRLVWADGGYAGKLVDWARTTVTLAVAIVKRSDDAAGFVVLPRRWVVERTLAWISGHRRCVRDYECLSAHHEAMVPVAEPSPGVAFQLRTPPRVQATTRPHAPRAW